MSSAPKSPRRKILIAMEGVLGGTLRHLDYLLRFADPARWDIHLAVSSRRAPHVKADFRRWSDAGWTVHEIPMCREISPMRDLRAFRSVLSLCRSEHFDLIHTHCAKAGFLGRLAGRLVGTRTVHTAHVFPFSHMGAEPVRDTYLALERLAARWTDRFIVLSHYQQNLLLDAGLAPVDHSDIIANGIVMADFQGPPRRKARRQLGLPEDAPIVLFAGRFRPQKGLDTLLKAACQLRASSDPPRIVIVGEGPGARWLEQQIASHDLTNIVMNRGFTEQMALYYAASDLLVMPSRAEGMPYVALEAQAAGRPVAASLVSGMEEFVEHGRTGFLFPRDNPDTLAGVLQTASSNRDKLARMGRRARERYPEKWQAHHMSRKTFRLYRHLIGSKTPGG